MEEVIISPTVGRQEGNRGCSGAGTTQYDMIRVAAKLEGKNKDIRNEPQRKKIMLKGSKPCRYVPAPNSEP